MPGSSFVQNVEAESQNRAHTYNMMPKKVRSMFRSSKLLWEYGLTFCCSGFSFPTWHTLQVQVNTCWAEVEAGPCLTEMSAFTLLFNLKLTVFVLILIFSLTCRLLLCFLKWAIPQTSWKQFTSLQCKAERNRKATAVTNYVVIIEMNLNNSAVGLDISLPLNIRISEFWIFSDTCSSQTKWQ